MDSSKDQKLWGGRFEQPVDRLMARFNASIGFDQRLAAQDIRASQAHARMLARQGIISEQDGKVIVEGLAQVGREIAEGRLAWQTELEDIHTHIEARLAEIIGEPAGRLHTARSRNDQVATDLRLWVLDAGASLKEALGDYQRALVELAENQGQAVMPGYTHLQRAQPVLLGHHMLAYEQMARRDQERLAQCAQRAARLPLGAAALAGTPHPVDPHWLAGELGLEGPCANSLDAVSDRDFAAEFLFGLSLIQVHLSRLAEELVLWSSLEFGFITLDEAFATGSSIMPQKKNPDAAELVRAKTGRVLGHLMALLTMLKGQPLAYNKDLQEDKEPLFDAFDTVYDSLRVMAPMLRTLTVHAGRMRAAVEQGFLNATELADYLVQKGVPFRQAHHLAGQAVLLAEKSERTLTQIGLEEYRSLCDKIGDDIYRRLTPEHGVDSRTSPGGTARHNLAAALKEARERLWPRE